jgi:gluconate 2-dehydrogenase gamma chain
MVNALCPADHMTPSGTTCGLATFIDRQLDGEFGRRHAQGAWEHGEAQAYPNLPLTQEGFFKAGIVSVNSVSRRQFGVGFSALAEPVAAELLRDIAAGRVFDSALPLAAWFNHLVDPLLVQASFAGPIYDEHLNKVFWKLFVSPVVPA